MHAYVNIVGCSGHSDWYQTHGSGDIQGEGGFLRGLRWLKLAPHGHPHDSCGADQMHKIFSPLWVNGRDVRLQPMTQELILGHPWERRCRHHWTISVLAGTMIFCQMQNNVEISTGRIREESLTLLCLRASETHGSFKRICTTQIKTNYN